MVRRFRARASCLLTAVVLALGTTATSVGELLHATTPHDLACAPALPVPHDESRHHVDAPKAADASGHHCVACHLARASRLGAQAVTHLGRLWTGLVLRPAEAIGSARSATLDLLPPRAPPRIG